MVHEKLVGKHTHLFAKPENFTPPTNNPDDCECGGAKPGAIGRHPIPNCPCCDGVQILVVDVCDCPDPSFIKFKVIVPPNFSSRIRLIESVEPIS